MSLRLKNGFVFAAIAFLSAAGFSAQASTASNQSEYVVKLRHVRGVSAQTLSAQSIGANLSAFGVRVQEQHTAGQLLKISIRSDLRVQALAALLQRSDVQYVVPNFKVRSFTEPVNVQALKAQWALKKVNAERAWQLAGNKGSRNVKVAVIDTGVDYNHPALKPNMVSGFDFITQTNDPMDKIGQNPGHGTHCAGIVGASGLVDGGTMGLSPEVSIMPLRFLDENGSGDLMNGIRAIDYAIQNKVDVISASWGANVSASEAKPLIEAVKRADDAGIIFVVAASNDGKNNDSFSIYPANSGYPNMISVAASDDSDAKPSWSNYGRASVHLAAPGADIISTIPGNKYASLSGTSMATPLVAGLVGLLKAHQSNLTGAQARALLQTTGAKVNIETACNCRIDAAAAVEAVKTGKMFMVPAAATLHIGDSQQLSVVNGTAPLKFVSSNPSVLSIDANGMAQALAAGDVTIEVQDGSGKTAKSLGFHVDGQSTPTNPGQPGDPSDPSQPGSCPIGDQATCDMICQLMPDLPFCTK